MIWKLNEYDKRREGTCDPPCPVGAAVTNVGGSFEKHRVAVCLDRKCDCCSSGSESSLVGATMASGGGKQATKIVSKSSAGGAGAAGASGGPPVMPLASPLMGKKKKPFLGMPAPLGYVPGLGRG